MKKIQLVIVSGLCAFALTNCAEPTGPNTQRGAVIGALGGAALGGIVGNQSGRALEGAAIGAAAGGGAGALYGNAQDQEQRRRYNQGY
jgi:outer membrane lipoprotein SlyB